MADSFSSSSLSGAQEVYTPGTGHEPESFSGRDWGDYNIGSVVYGHSFNLNNCFNTEDVQSGKQKSFLESLTENPDMDPNMVFTQSLPGPAVGEDCGRAPKKEKVYPTFLSSLDLLKNYSAGNRLNGSRINDLSSGKISLNVGTRELSTEDVIRIAGIRYIQISDHKEDGDPFNAMFLSLKDEDSKDVELVHSLLASAEKIGSGLYDRASKMLLQCEYLSSRTGNPIQRLVYYFADALHGRVDRETGRISSKGLMESQLTKCIAEDMVGSHPSLLAFHHALPFAQVVKFMLMQIILDSVGSARKIHLIDLGIRTGMHWTVLMQALSVRSGPPLLLLRITAVGTSAEKISETGKRLAIFAEALNLPFSFNMVVITDMEELKEDMFRVDGSESVAAYAQTVLRNMINKPRSLEHLMKVIRNLKPIVMAVSEVEANHNSPSFVDRFIEALFFYGAYFDAVDAAMDRFDKNRLSLESTFFAPGIRNIVATDGIERHVRHVEIDTWRSFLTRIGFVETELSLQSLQDADLIVKQSASGSFCTLGMKGKAFMIGWKGTPLHFVSAWKQC